MRLLVLGGTSFVGRHLVEAALANGHEVTVFHRGRTNPHLFPEAQHLLGDRASGDYGSLRGGRWDATVDVCAYVPRHVEQALDALGDRAGHCVLVSSISAYDEAAATRDEDSPTHPGPAPNTEQVDAATYGPLKAACERVLVERLGRKACTVVRPTYVAGPYDPTDRFTYWARTMAEGGAVPVVWPSAPLQVIDARDLAAFMLRLARTATPGEFDAVGPYGPLAEMLAQMAVPDVAYRLVEIDPSRLADLGTELPLVDGSREAVPLLTRPGSRAAGAGLRAREVAETARATVTWDRARGCPPLAIGPSVTQRAALVR